MKALFNLLLFLSLSFQVFASEKLTTNDFKVVYKKVIEQTEKYGRENVLVVYDVDNTLLAMNQDLGSDQWFDWQSSLLTDNNSPDRVASDFNSLLVLQQKLYSLSGMHKPETVITDVIEDFRRQNIKQLALTSRGPEMRDSTLRELRKNKLNLEIGKENELKTYYPYDLTTPEKNCLSQEDIQRLKLGNPRLVSFDGAIMFSSGQHKGAVLRSILCEVPTKYKAIVFVDDKQKNVDAVQDGYLNTEINVITYRYSAEDDKVSHFHSSDKAKARADWTLLKSTLDKVFAD